MAGISARSERAAAIRSLLWPRSVAIIGATDDHTKMNGAPVRNLIDFGFEHSVYPVTPRHSSLFGVPCYASLDAIEGPIDTAVVAVRADRAVDAIERCARRGVPSVTLVSAGFMEGAAGEEGDALTDALRETLRRFPIRLLGPNTAGLLNLRHRYVPRAAFNQFGPEQAKVGGTAIVCQSGAISNTLYNKCQAHALGVAYSVATGDQLDLDAWDFVEFALEDDAVTVVLCAVEGYRDARRFAEVAQRAAELRKPLILLKLGKSEAGARAVATHSGSMAGSYENFRAICAQTGTIEVDDFDAFWEIAILFERWGREQADPRGRSLGVVSLSGGEGALIADSAFAHRLTLPDPGEHFARHVAEAFSFAKGTNPFDPTGEAIGNRVVLEGAVDAFLGSAFDYTLIASPVMKSEIADVLFQPIVRAVERHPRARIAISAWTAGALTFEGTSLLQTTGLPLFENSVRAVAAIDSYHRWAAARHRRTELVYADAGHARPDPFYVALRREMLAAGIPFAQAWALADEAAEAVALGPAQARLDFTTPRVLKLNCRSQVHKSRFGLVALGVSSDAALRERLRAMPRDVEHDGWIVEEQLHADLELFVGGATDPDFGKVLLVGFGGRLAEVLPPPALHIGRVPPEALQAWLDETPAGRLAAGAGAALHAAFAGCVAAAAEWFLADPAISSFDLNPVVLDLSAAKLCAVDCRAA
jgi:acetyltransferase